SRLGHAQIGLSSHIQSPSAAERCKDRLAFPEFPSRVRALSLALQRLGEPNADDGFDYVNDRRLPRNRSGVSLGGAEHLIRFGIMAQMSQRNRHLPTRDY